MAVIDKQGHLHGTVGSVVYRRVGDLNIVQSRPRKFKQTLATRESGLEFGLASSTACSLREVLRPAYHSPDRGMANRLTTTVLKCIRAGKDKARGDRDIHDGDVSLLKGFQFNKNSPLTEFLTVRPVVEQTEEGRLVLSLPAAQWDKELICPLKDYGSITVRLVATAVHFRSEYFQYLGNLDIRVKRGVNMPAQRWEVEEQLPAGSLVLVTVSLLAGSQRAFSEMTMNSQEWDPGEIVEALQVPQGEAEVLDPEYILNSAAWRQRTGKPGYQRSRTVKDLMPLTGYFGKAYTGKIADLREKMKQKQTAKELRRAASEVAWRIKEAEREKRAADREKAGEDVLKAADVKEEADTMKTEVKTTGTGVNATETEVEAGPAVIQVAPAAGLRLPKGRMKL